MEVWRDNWVMKGMIENCHVARKIGWRMEGGYEEDINEQI